MSTSALQLKGNVMSELLQKPGAILHQINIMGVDQYRLVVWYHD